MSPLGAVAAPVNISSNVIVASPAPAWTVKNFPPVKPAVITWSVIMLFAVIWLLVKTKVVPLLSFLNLPTVEFIVAASPAVVFIVLAVTENPPDANWIPSFAVTF